MTVSKAAWPMNTRLVSPAPAPQDPGKLTDNAMIEAFNARLREECLNESWFLSLEDA